MNFTHQRAFTLTPEEVMAFQKYRTFECKLCGQKFEAGHVVRWIYANGTPGFGGGNFFVCSTCDTGYDQNNSELIAAAKAQYETAKMLAKRWGIRGG